MNPGFDLRTPTARQLEIAASMERNARERAERELDIGWIVSAAALNPRGPEPIAGVVVDQPTPETLLVAMSDGAGWVQYRRCDDKGRAIDKHYQGGEIGRLVTVRLDAIEPDPIPARPAQTDEAIRALFFRAACGTGEDRREAAEAAMTLLREAE